MLDDGTNGDGAAGDSKFGIALENKPLVQYYLIAEGGKTAKLSPEKACFEFHEVK